MDRQLLDHQALRRALEAAGLRCTLQRLAVYDHLARSPDHPTVEDVYQSVRSAIPKISLATVYKALEAFLGYHERPSGGQPIASPIPSAPDHPPGGTATEP
jgi:hypothetical protein